MTTVRKSNSHHEVYGIHSANHLSAELRGEDTALPLIWALDSFKWLQERFPAPLRKQLHDPVPPNTALREFKSAMDRWDFETAERAIVGVLRGWNPGKAIDILWPYAVRDWGLIGHKVIAVTNCWRILHANSFEGAEPVFRFMVATLGEGLKGDEESQTFTQNQERASQVSTLLPQDWVCGSSDAESVPRMVSLIRQGSPEEASSECFRSLKAGLFSAVDVWDAVHLAAAELMIRHKQGSYNTTNPGQGLNNRPLHSNTAANALRYAFISTPDQAKQLLILLQSVAWLAEFTRVEDGRGHLRDLTIFSPEHDASKACSHSEILQTLPPRPMEQSIEDRSDQDRAAQMAFNYVRGEGDANLFWSDALSLLAQKANEDHHDCKFPVAMLETIRWTRPRWHPHLTAAAVTWLHGPSSADSNVFTTAKQYMGR